MASRLGVSLGKVNYSLQALVERGLIKARSLRTSERKKRHMYVLTPKGVRERALYAYRFLKQKAAEYEELLREIEELEKRNVSFEDAGLARE